MPEIVADNIDRICTVEQRPGHGNLPRGTIRAMYDIAREREGGPLSLAIAEAVLDATNEDGPDARLLIVTGAGGPPYLPHGEVDGLLGAAAMARAFHLATGVEVHVTVEERIVSPMRAALEAAGLNVVMSGEPVRDHTAVIHVSPISHDDSKTWSHQLLDELDPAAVIAIEKLAPNHKGVIHGATGLSYDDVHFKPQYLFEEAASRGIVTCGIGDGGNEVGFGTIHEEVVDIMPAGRQCLCACEGGSVTVVPTDKHMVAAISDWGGYGVAAVVAYLRGRQDLLMSTDEMERMLAAVVDHGAYDGAIARPVLADDGVPLRGQRAMVEMLHVTVSQAFSELSSPGH